MNLSNFSAVAALMLACSTAFANDVRVIAVETRAPSLSAEQTEAQVTTQLENRLSKVAGVLEVRSSSAQGRSYIELYTNERDISGVIAKVRLIALETKPSLPKSAGQSTVSEPATALLR
jgi:multidrug efflux pump